MKMLPSTPSFSFPLVRARHGLRLAVLAGAVGALVGCASVGAGIGVPVFPGVSIGVGVGSGGVSVGASAGAGPVGVGIGVDNHGRVGAGVGVGVGTDVGNARVGVGVGTGTTLYDPARDRAAEPSAPPGATTAPAPGTLGPWRRVTPGPDRAPAPTGL